jgi:hypothetical protein
MKYDPKSSWVIPMLGWKKISISRRHNRSNFPRIEKTFLFPTLDPPIPPLSRLEN